ncbi:uncharacterized protein LOC134346424 [Mobula hypostoma]|uniref:uncharacterized protein LOC134346424 n=1 Tax=Mobula hypostoma TaxID=723540 RepID=UPI002FC3CCAA
MEVRWFRTDWSQVVHLYRKGQDIPDIQMAQYSGRTELFKDAFPQGNVSLLLKKVTVGDTGHYKCFVVSKAEDQEGSLQLQVARSNMDILLCELLFKLNWHHCPLTPLHPPGMGHPPTMKMVGYEGNRILVGCVSEKWFPQPLVLWRDAAGQLISARQESAEPDAGLLRVESVIAVSRSTPGVYSCVIRNQLLGREHEGRLEISGPFTIHDIRHLPGIRGFLGTNVDDIRGLGAEEKDGVSQPRRVLLLLPEVQLRISGLYPDQLAPGFKLRPAIRSERSASRPLNNPPLQNRICDARRRSVIRFASSQGRSYEEVNNLREYQISHEPLIQPLPKRLNRVLWIEPLFQNRPDEARRQVGNLPLSEAEEVYWTGREKPLAPCESSPEQGKRIGTGLDPEPGSAAVNMASRGQVESWSEEAICPICLDFFTDPVSLECGHNFCRSCITLCWESAKINTCPECREVFADGKLRPSRVLARLAEKARKLNLNPKEKESKLHCEEHGEELKLFCETDRTLICVICAASQEHREHRFLTIKEGFEIYKDRVKWFLDSLTKKKSDFEKIEQQQKEKISRVREQSRSLQSHIISQFAELRQILTEKEQHALRHLREEEERILNPMEKNLQEIQENLNSIQEEISKLQEQMDQQENVIFLMEKVLQKRRIKDDVQELSVTDEVFSAAKFDHPYLLNTALRETLDAVNQDSVTLDVETVNPELELTADRKSMRLTETRRDLPDTGKRFRVWGCVLGLEGFTSGRHYWEVEVAGNRYWSLGVAAESVDRGGGVGLRPETGFWIISRIDDVICVPTSPESHLPAGPIPGRVGVYLSYESGTVSFYNAKTKSHLHTFTGNKFVEKVYPFFRTWDTNHWLRICSGSAPDCGARERTWRKIQGPVPRRLSDTDLRVVPRTHRKPDIECCRKITNSANDTRNILVCHHIEMSAGLPNLGSTAPRLMDRVKSAVECLTEKKSELEEMERQQKDKIAGVRVHSLGMCAGIRGIHLRETLLGGGGGRESVLVSGSHRFWIITGVDHVICVPPSSESHLPAGPTPGSVGVYLSYESGTVSFYNAETKSHLHTFTGNKFTENLYPFSGLGIKSGG